MHRAPVWSGERKQRKLLAIFFCEGCNERDAPLRNTRRPRAGAGGQRGTARFEACRGARRETFDAGQFDLDAHLLTRGPNDLFSWVCLRGSQSISTRRAAALGRGFTPHITALRRAGWHVGDERRGEAAPWWPSCCQASASASAGLCALVRQVEPRPGGGLRRGLRGVADDRACRGQARDARRGWSYPSTTREATKVKVHTQLRTHVSTNLYTKGGPPPAKCPFHSTTQRAPLPLQIRPPMLTRFARSSPAPPALASPG